MFRVFRNHLQNTHIQNKNATPPAQPILCLKHWWRFSLSQYGKSEGGGGGEEEEGDAWKGRRGRELPREGRLFTLWSPLFKAALQGSLMLGKLKRKTIIRDNCLCPNTGIKAFGTHLSWALVCDPEKWPLFYLEWGEHIESGRWRDPFALSIGSAVSAKENRHRGQDERERKKGHQRLNNYQGKG